MYLVGITILGRKAISYNYEYDGTTVETELHDHRSITAFVFVIQHTIGVPKPSWHHRDIMLLPYPPNQSTP